MKQPGCIGGVAIEITEAAWREPREALWNCGGRLVGDVSFSLMSPVYEAVRAAVARPIHRAQTLPSTTC